MAELRIPSLVSANDYSSTTHSNIGRTPNQANPGGLNKTSPKEGLKRSKRLGSKTSAKRDSTSFSRTSGFGKPTVPIISNAKLKSGIRRGNLPSTEYKIYNEKDLMPCYQQRYLDQLQQDKDMKEAVAKVVKRNRKERTSKKIQSIRNLNEAEGKRSSEATEDKGTKDLAEVEQDKKDIECGQEKFDIKKKALNSTVEPQVTNSAESKSVFSPNASKCECTTVNNNESKKKTKFNYLKRFRNKPKSAYKTPSREIASNSRASETLELPNSNGLPPVRNGHKRKLWFSKHRTENLNNTTIAMSDYERAHTCPANSNSQKCTGRISELISTVRDCGVNKQQVLSPKTANRLDKSLKVGVNTPDQDWTRNLFKVTLREESGTHPSTESSTTGIKKKILVSRIPKRVMPNPFLTQHKRGNLPQELGGMPENLVHKIPFRCAMNQTTIVENAGKTDPLKTCRVNRVPVKRNVNSHIRSKLGSTKIKSGKPIRLIDELTSPSTHGIHKSKLPAAEMNQKKSTSNAPKELLRPVDDPKLNNGSNPKVTSGNEMKDPSSFNQTSSTSKKDASNIGPTTGGEKNDTPNCNSTAVNVMKEDTPGGNLTKAVAKKDDSILNQATTGVKEDTSISNQTTGGSEKTTTREQPKKKPLLPSATKVVPSTVKNSHLPGKPAVTNIFIQRDSDTTFPPDIEAKTSTEEKVNKPMMKPAKVDQAANPAQKKPWRFASRVVYEPTIYDTKPDPAVVRTAKKKQVSETLPVERGICQSGNVQENEKSLPDTHPGGERIPTSVEAPKNKSSLPQSISQTEEKVKGASVKLQNNMKAIPVPGDKIMVPSVNAQLEDVHIRKKQSLPENKQSNRAINVQNKPVGRPMSPSDRPISPSDRPILPSADVWEKKNSILDTPLGDHTIARSAESPSIRNKEKSAVIQSHCVESLPDTFKSTEEKTESPLPSHTGYLDLDLFTNVMYIDTAIDEIEKEYDESAHDLERLEKLDAKCKNDIERYKKIKDNIAKQIRMLKVLDSEEAGDASHVTT